MVKLSLGGIFTLLLFYTVSSKDNPIVILSIPKCGTHMLIKCIEMITQNKNIKSIPWVPKTYGACRPFIKKASGIIDDNKKSCFFRGHLVYDYELEKLFKLKQCKTFFIYRDPRAQLTSWIKFIKKGYSDDYISNRMLMLIDGSITYGIPTKFDGSLTGLYKAYMPWAFCKNVFALRFEDLVGSKGGGNSKKQYTTIKNIAEFLEVNLNSNEINKMCEQLFGGTATFSQGQIDGWKKYFTQEHKLAFKQNAGQLLTDLGYEKDVNW